MMSQLTQLIPATVISVLVLAGPMFAAGSDTAEGVAYFEQHIRPLLARRCYGCHSSRADKQEGGLLLDTQQGWEVGGESGPAIVPGNPGTSLLISRIRDADPDVRMPPTAPLPKFEAERLEQWVRMGAPDPRTVHQPTIDADSGNPSDPVTGRTHWAFRPLAGRRTSPDPTGNWSRTPVDEFISARRKSAGLQPAADARPRDLVRRVYFQLIGLPPTPEQIDVFLNDTRADSLARLVDRLMSSPQFGERWGRHWLDLARYADSNGLDENFLFREAWRYRNWVIDAVNADMPFDRFVLEQIAGDLLPSNSTEQRDRQRIASGFLVVGPKVLLGNQEQRQQMEIADEQIDTIGRAILGLTLGCARCHDHKFDPVPTADYYALAGILTSTQVMEKRHMLNQQRVMERLVGLGSEGDSRDAAYEEFYRGLPELRQRAQQAKSALDHLKKDDEPAFEAVRKDAAEAVAEDACDTGRPLEERIKSQAALVRELATTIANAPQIPPRAMIAADVDLPADEPIRIAGAFDSLGEEVPRGFLQVLYEGVPKISEGQSGRIELGRWLADEDDGAGDLAARVIVNRIWHHVVGRGIVRTVDNFGRTGEAPSHPELLDYLAWRLVDSGWSIKSVVREVVLSRTNAMSSEFDEAAHAIDPDNVLLWRFGRRRLDPEALRDAMLAAAGTLDVTPMDSTVWYLGDQATAVGDNKNRRRTDFPCRSVYLPVIRNDLPELFEVFDFANPQATTGARPQTTVATQALFILNADLVIDASQATARRVLDDPGLRDPDQRIDWMFERILACPPTEEERQEFLTFIRQTNDRFDDDAEDRAWAMACHALFASSRFQFLE